MKIRFSLLFLGACLLAAPALSAEHSCAAEALARGKKLLRFHVEDVAPTDAIDDGATVKVLPPVNALKGSGKFDVLEITSHIYKASYRMRFIYVQTKDKSCGLMGQEIIENSNPY